MPKARDHQQLEEIAMESTAKPKDKVGLSTGTNRRQKTWITVLWVFFIGGLIVPQLLSLKWGAAALWVGGLAFLALVLWAVLRLNQVE